MFVPWYLRRFFLGIDIGIFLNDQCGLVFIETVQYLYGKHASWMMLKRLKRLYLCTEPTPFAEHCKVDFNWLNHKRKQSFTFLSRQTSRWNIPRFGLTFALPVYCHLHYMYVIFNVYQHFLRSGTISINIFAMFLSAPFLCLALWLARPFSARPSRPRHTVLPRHTWYSYSEC